MGTQDNDAVDELSELAGFGDESAKRDAGPMKIDATYFVGLAKLRSCERTAAGIELAVDDVRMRVDVLRSDVVRLKITRSGQFDEEPTHAVCADTSAMRAPFTLEESKSEVCVSTDDMRLVFHRAPFRVDAVRTDGSAIFESPSGPGAAPAYAFLNDEFLVTRRCRVEDAIYGLGEKTGRLNRKGRSFTLWNTDVLNPDSSGRFTAGLAKGDPRRDASSTSFDPYYISIPLFQHLDAASGAASGFFIDNGYEARFEFEDAEQYRYRFSGGQYTEYVFAGPGLRQIIERYTELTGRMSAPPMWSLGYHQCRWHKYTQADIENMALRYRSEGIPCDALWLDIEYMNGYRVFTWNTTTFPDAPKMLKELAQHGLRCISIIDPGVKAEPGYAVFDSGIAGDVFCKTPSGNIYTGQVWPGRTAFPDFAKESARRWWGALNAAHVESGLAGIWNDMNEPATGSISERSMWFDGGRAPHEKYHNQYALLMAMATQEGLLAAMPGKRTFILSRAGSAGIQRFAANWMGDNMSRWDHLWMSMPMAMGLGMSGQAFVGADIGGFAESTNPELFLRWMQYGALTPFCRNHNNAGSISQYPWSFGETIRNLVRESIRLRYRLMPAIYTMFMDSCANGVPIQRPLAIDYQDDPVARDVDDEYLFGENLLVAPVVRAGMTSRQVYLPRGGWISWASDDRYEGGSFVVTPTPMDGIPMFVREGAVIPMWPEAPQSTMGYHPTSIELHVFVPMQDGARVSRLHEDDGITFAHLTGGCFRTEFEVVRTAAELSITAETTGSGYPEFARREFMVVFHGDTPTQVSIAGEIHAVRDGVVRIANAGMSFRLNARLGPAQTASTRNGEFHLSGRT